MAHWKYHGVDIAKLAQDPAMLIWRKLTDTMQSSFATSDAHEHWAPMYEVFYTAETNKDISK